MKRSTRHVYSICIALICGGGALLFFPYVLQDFVGYYPGVIYFGQIVAGLGLIGGSLLNFRRGMGTMHLGVTVVAIALALFSGRLFLQSVGVMS